MRRKTTCGLVVILGFVSVSLALLVGGVCGQEPLGPGAPKQEPKSVPKPPTKLENAILEAAFGVWARRVPPEIWHAGALLVGVGEGVELFLRARDGKPTEQPKDAPRHPMSQEIVAELVQFSDGLEKKGVAPLELCATMCNIQMPRLKRGQDRFGLMRMYASVVRQTGTDPAKDGVTSLATFGDTSTQGKDIVPIYSIYTVGRRETGFVANVHFVFVALQDGSWHTVEMKLRFVSERPKADWRISRPGKR